MAIANFLEACGLSTPLTIECDDPGLPAAATVRHEQTLPFAVVGRDPSSDLHLNDPLISRRHAYLQVIAGGLFCVDLGSRSRIQWEGASEPATRGWLEQDSFIWLGGCRIRWRGNAGERAQGAERLDPLAPAPIDRPDTEPLPEASLELPIRIGASSSTWTVGSRLNLIGRADLCQLVLTDISISTYHASLLRTPQGVWVVDLLSREGVWVNGTRVRWAWLGDGDTLRIGRFTFVLRYGSLPKEISRADVPLDAGAILTASPIGTANPPNALPAQMKKPLALCSSQPAQSGAPIAPYSAIFGPLSAVSGGGADLNRITDFGAAPPASWNQHIQFLEMVHSEMILMVKMFMTMHREQVGSIRDELDRVQQLTRELETLQAKLAESSNVPRTAATTRLDRGRRETPSRSSVDAESEQGPSIPTPSSQTGSRPHRKFPPGEVNSVPGRDKVSEAVGSEHPAERASSPVDMVNLHAQISTRIAELQRERQGYWRTILSVMSRSED